MKKYLILFLLSLSLLLCHAFYTKHAIYGDGNGYYATSHSLLYDQTFNSPNILTHLQNFPGRDYTFSRVFWDTSHNPYSVGTSLSWIPSLSFISLFSANPYDLLHELGPGITGILFMLAGLYFLEKYLNTFFSSQTSVLVVMTLYFGTNLFYYSSLEPALSHQPSFFLISFLLYWTTHFVRSTRNLFILGLLFGFVHITRIADTLLLIPIFFSLRLSWRNLIPLTLGGLLGITPQLLAQHFYYATFLRNFYVTEHGAIWSFNPIHFFEYLFSPKRGLFVWSPAFLFGFWYLLKNNHRLIIFTLLLIWSLGSFWSPASALTAGFGQRLSFAATPYFALGLGYLYQNLSRQKALLLASTFMLWNIFLLYGFYLLDWKNLP